jgi:AraC-like DNA-binding protein
VRTFRHLRDNEVDQLVAKYEAGATVLELGELLGISRQTVGNYLRQRGIDTRPRGLAPEDVGAAAVLYQRGWSLARIADRFDTSPNTVRSRFKEVGITMRDTHGRERSAPERVLIELCLNVARPSVDQDNEVDRPESDVSDQGSWRHR